MKKICLLAAAVLMLAGCNKWLDVKPRGESSEKMKFATERGFQSALIGVYTMMAEADLYGSTASMTVPELIAQHWSPQTKSDATVELRADLSHFLYTTDKTRPTLDAMFLKYYKCIAQLNVILRNLENTDVNFVGQHKRMFMGEVLGLRAFLHFELMKFFGPAPLTATPDQPTLPYLLKTSIDPRDLRYATWKQFFEAVDKDLAAARNQLQDIDPVFTYSQHEMGNLNIGDHGFAPNMADQNRRRRFNYYAVVATQARVQSWLGNKTAAADLAQLVIDASNPKNDNGKPGATFNLTTGGNFGSGWNNYAFDPEHIFGLSNPDLQAVVGEKFKGAPANAGTVAKPPYLAQTYEYLKLNDGFDPNHNPNDIRAITKFWHNFDPLDDKESRLMVFNKYIDIEKGGTLGSDLKSANRIPLIRLAEMYFMVIEAKSVTDAKVNKLIENFCVARNMGQRLWVEMTDDNKMDYLEKEYRKDFYGEGVMFGFYKRLNYSKFTWPVETAVPAGSYQLPRPDMQAVYDPYPDMGITPEQ